MKNAARGKFDPYLSLLDYRNTPKNACSSPAQRLFNRRTRNLLLLSPKQLEPVTVPLQDVEQRLIASRQIKSRRPITISKEKHCLNYSLVRLLGWKSLLKTPGPKLLARKWLVHDPMLLVLVTAPFVEIIDSYVCFHPQIKQRAVLRAASSHMRMVARSSPSVHHLKDPNLFQLTQVQQAFLLIWHPILSSQGVTA